MCSSRHLSLTISHPFSLICPPCLCHSSRPSRPAEREAHRAASGDGASLSGAAAEAKPPRLSAAVRQAAPENDGPASDRHWPRPPHPAAEEDGDWHVLTPTVAGDHEGLVLDFNKSKKKEKKKKKGQATKSVKEGIERFYYWNQVWWN